jgi:hypothetical protein
MTTPKLRDCIKRAYTSCSSTKCVSGYPHPAAHTSLRKMKKVELTYLLADLTLWLIGSVEVVKRAEIARQLYPGTMVDSHLTINLAADYVLNSLGPYTSSYVCVLYSQRLDLSPEDRESVTKALDDVFCIDPSLQLDRLCSLPSLTLKRFCSNIHPCRLPLKHLTMSHADILATAFCDRMIQLMKTPGPQLNEIVHCYQPSYKPPRHGSRSMMLVLRHEFSDLVTKCLTTNSSGSAFHKVPDDTIYACLRKYYNKTSIRVPIPCACCNRSNVTLETCKCQDSPGSCHTQVYFAVPSLFFCGSLGIILRYKPPFDTDSSMEDSVTIADFILVFLFVRSFFFASSDLDLLCRTKPF